MVVIAVTGMPGAGSSTISKMLAKKLKIKYFSPGEYFKKHSKRKIETDQALSYWKTKEGSSKKLHNYIENLQIEMAKGGNIVICGKLSIFALRNIPSIKIWLKCSLEERARRTSERDKIDIEEAIKKITEREKIEDTEWKKIYGIDRKNQQKWADLIVDTTKINREQTVKFIFKKIKAIL